MNRIALQAQISPRAIPAAESFEPCWRTIASSSRLPSGEAQNGWALRSETNAFRESVRLSSNNASEPRYR